MIGDIRDVRDTKMETSAALKILAKDPPTTLVGGGVIAILISIAPPLRTAFIVGLFLIIAGALWKKYLGD